MPGEAVVDVPASPGEHEAPGEKGLKASALGFVSSVVIGVASTAPGYSLAATLGFVTAVVGIGYQAPIVMVIAFIPMLLIALAFKYLNQADPDCGTTFSWGTRAFGPVTGWLGGWGIIYADVLVMASLSQIAGIYTFLLFGQDDLAASRFWVGVVGVIWILAMSLICYVGVEASAKTQWFLLGAEIIALAVFSIVALARVYIQNPIGSVHPSLSWLNPLDISSFGALTSGLLLAIFIYWGWDTAVSVNEETEDATKTPGKAAVVSTLLLLGIYVIVSIAAQAYHGVEFLNENQDDVLSALGKRRPAVGTRQDPDHRGADVGLGLDADDDPPDHAGEPLDGRARRDPEALRAHPPALPDAERLHDLDVHHLDHLLRDAELPQRVDPGGLGHGDRFRDRVLLRADRLRVHLVLPARAAAERPQPVLRRGCCRSSAGSPSSRSSATASTSQTNSDNYSSSLFGMSTALAIAIMSLILGIVILDPAADLRAGSVLPAQERGGEAGHPRRGARRRRRCLGRS